MMVRSKVAGKQLRLGWLSTGRGSGSQALLRSAQSAISEGSLDASIDFVLCTREPGEAQGSDEFLALAQDFDLKTIPLSFKGFRERNSDAKDWRKRYDEEMAKEISQHNVDGLVFAGLLIIVGDDVVQQYPALNLHPAAPRGPIGTWQEVISELVLERSPKSGVSVQIATPELDLGPVVAFCKFPVRGPSYDSLWEDVWGDLAERMKSSNWNSQWLDTMPEAASPWTKLLNRTEDRSNAHELDRPALSSRLVWETSWSMYRNSVINRRESFGWNTYWPSLKHKWEALLRESLLQLLNGVDSTH